jgi:aryl-alcohol dehydrogenase-like predicted oxidoreductase
VKLRTLGRTELAVSEIGFGCGPTGGLMINGSAAERREAVACALDLGINYFDTAAVYGAGVSETHLGETLRELGARVAVATKVALAPGDLRDIVGAVQRSVEDSLRRLGLGELALIQLHNRIGLERAARAPFGTGALLASADVAGPDGVLEAFERLRTRGLVHHFGCSAFGGDMGMVRNLIDGDRFEVLTLHYSILNRTAWSAHQGAAMLDYAQVGRRAASRHMATVALRVLEGGALAEAGTAARRDPATCAAAARLAETLDRAGIDPAEGAIRFVLSNPEVGVVLVGFSDIREIRAAASYSNRGPLDRNLLNLIEGI